MRCPKNGAQFNDVLINYCGNINIVYSISNVTMASISSVLYFQNGDRW